jgi:hypothetical protein
VTHRTILQVHLTLGSYLQQAGDTINTVYAKNSYLDNMAYETVGKKARFIMYR